jgi:peroxiredoxin
MKRFTVSAMALAACAGLMAQAQPAGEVLQPLKIGDVAPNFTLSSTMGGKVTLADFKGKSPVVLAFFPAAFTGG